MIIGIDAPGGVPKESFEGIDFADREPGLTVQNICREDIFPEVPIYTRFVPSQVEGRGFLVVQVNESPRAPHAIENSTLVYVRTDGATEKTALADIPRIERMLSRRANVSRQWEEFFIQSEIFAQSSNLNIKYAYREMRVGPLYPVEVVMTRELVYEFLSDPARQRLAGFHLGQILRTPAGGLLVRIENAERFLNVGDLGIMHYIEPCYPPNYQGGAKNTLDFWQTAVPIRKMLRLMGALVEFANISCDLRIEASLKNISGQEFLSGRTQHNSVPIATVASSVRASAQMSSNDVEALALEATGDLMYQLRWPFGKEPAPTIEDVRRSVAGLLTFS